MRVTAMYDLRGTMGNAVEWATQREALGLDGIHFPEVARNPFTSLTLAAEHTDSIRIGTSVAIAFARSPYVMANLGWDLQQYSGGRLVLGLGTQVKGHNERRFSVPWGPPTARLREYVEIFRMLLRGERLHYRGEIFEMSRGFQISVPRGARASAPRTRVSTTATHSTVTSSTPAPSTTRTRGSPSQRCDLATRRSAPRSRTG